MAGDVAAFGGLVLGIATTVQSIVDNLYRANAALKELPRQVQNLQEKVEILQREARNIGALSSNAALIKRLQDVQTSLQKENEKLDKIAGSGVSKFRTRATMTMFPARVGQRFQSTNDEFDDILKSLGLLPAIKYGLNKAMMCTAVSTVIAPDPRYVPLVDSEEKICRALEDPKGPGVVLLHGGPGFGKSTLARKMVVHYTNLPMDGKKFDLVFFLDCSSGPDAVDTQVDIIRRLGYEPAASTQEADKGAQIEKQLRGLLAAQKILLIQDDVSDGDFLHEIVKLCSPTVKCLVTSQRADLCQRVLEKDRYISVQIQVVPHEVARKILASHLELPNHDIPPHLQGLADKMIFETECIPLALSSLANVIDHDQANDLDVWEDASTHFFEALKSDVPTRVLGGKYLKSFWATTWLAMDNLSDDANNLLLLTSACEGPSVPEKIVQLLYRSKKLTGVVGNFSNARSQLVNRHLITTSLSAKNRGTEDSNWSMHSLLKRYIEEEMKDRRDAMFTSLCLGKDAANPVIVEQIEDIEKKMVTTVCALYLEGELGKRAASRSLLDKDDLLFEDRKEAIEPVTCLLGRIKSDRWTETARHYAMEVFVKYICNEGDLCGEGISYILGLPSAAPTMLEALKHMTSWRPMFKLKDDDNTLKLMNTLANQLAEGVDKGIQMTTLHVLANLIRDDVSPGQVHVDNWFSLKSLGASALEGNIRLLMTNSDQPMQELCVRIFENLMDRLSRQNKGKEMEIWVGWGGVIASLLNLLRYKDSNVENRFLQIEMVKMLSDIAFHVPMAVKVVILNYPGLLPKVMWLLSMDDNPTLQRIVLEMLRGLLDGADQNKTTIVNCVSLLKELARLLCKVGDHQVKVVRLFATLAKVEDDSSKMKIKTMRGIIECLITLSMSRPSERDNDSLTLDKQLQEFVAEALTLLDHDQGNKLYLHSRLAYGGRARRIQG